MISFKRLRNIREDNDMKQETIANILGVNRSTYSLWELEVNIMPLDKLCKFAAYFNTSIDYVLGLTNDKTNNRVIKNFNTKILGDNLKYLRIKNNLSQDNVAKVLNVTQACIVRYEKGLICISIANLYKYSKLFKVSMNDLCNEMKNKN